MPTLDERLVEIFTAIVASYDRQPPERRQRLTHHRTWDYERFLEWDQSMPAVTRDDLDELLDLGLIDIDFTGGGDYTVRPTSDGRRSLRTLQRERARSEQPQQAVDLNWSAVRPVLHAIVDLWTEAGAPLGSFVAASSIAKRLDRAEDDLSIARAIETLARNDWLEASYDDATDELEAMPTMRGLVATRGWPGGDGEVAAERLLSALDELAAGAEDEKTRSWAARLRDTATEVGTKTLAEVVSKSVGAAM
jgi:hypothetical protein